ncbi:L-xylulose reductase [Lamellibrachia satsuma]|nr:L-xylulose reductase [Lamellibrachia satsuma]
MWLEVGETGQYGVRNVSGARMWLEVGDTEDCIMDAMYQDQVVAGDLSDWTAAKKAVEEIGPVDLLVNNAGIVKHGAFVETEEVVLNKTFEVNVTAAVNVSQVVARGMVDIGKGGAIVNISSTSSRMAVPLHTSYCASKGALDQVTRVMALELGPHQYPLDSYLYHIDKLPKGVNERLMTMRIRLSGENYATIVSAYAPTMTYSDEEKENFYESLKTTIGRVPRSDKLIVLGDFNARVGRDHETWERVIGHHGMGNENANGSLLLNMCAEYQLTITNTLFQQANKYKTSWMHPRSKHWHLIDYVIVRQRDSRYVKKTCTIGATTC